MSYYLAKTVQGNFDDVIEKTIKSLSSKGFGVVSDIDMKATFMNKLQKDFKNYRILGACNPQIAFNALQKEDKLGTLLPCNVTVVEQSQGQIEISIIDPNSMIEMTGNEELIALIGEVTDMLNAALEQI